MVRREELDAKASEEFSPTAADILVPDAVTKAPARSRTKSKLSDMHGSFTLQDVHGEKKRRIAEEKAAADEAAAKRAAAEKKKSDAAQERDALVAGFEACEHGCVCPSQPCAWASWKRVARPAGPRRGYVRSVRACVAARRPLALTYVAAEGDACVTGLLLEGPA